MKNVQYKVYVYMISQMTSVNTIVHVHIHVIQMKMADTFVMQRE